MLRVFDGRVVALYPYAVNSAQRERELWEGNHTGL